MEEYRGYEIKQNDYSVSRNGSANFIFRNLQDCDEPSGWGETVQDCKTQIDEMLA